jgi:hypothetical protein
MRSSFSSQSSGRVVATTLMLAAALVAGAALATASIAHADAPRRQARDTHIGQRLDDFVVLNLINPTASPIFVRCHDDGTRDTTEFTVPTGSRMVVTECDWYVKGSNVATTNILRLFVEKSSNRYLAMIQPSGSANNSGSTGGGSIGTFGSTGLVSGFVVGSGARVVPDLQLPTAQITSTTVAAFPDSNTIVVLRGYLVKDE